MKRIAGTGLLCYRALRSSNRRTEAACRKAGGHVQRSDRQKHPILRGWKHKRNRHLWIATAYASAASTGRASRPPIRQAALKRGDLKSSALPHMGHLLITSFFCRKVRSHLLQRWQLPPGLLPGRSVSSFSFPLTASADPSATIPRKNAACPCKTAQHII